MAAVVKASVDLVYFDACGGLRAAAQALAGVIEGRQRPWRVRCVDLVKPGQLQHLICGSEHSAAQARALG